MKLTELLLKEMRALQRSTGDNAARGVRETEAARLRLTAEAIRNDETDAALVELAGLDAAHEATQEEVMAAQVELAGLVDTAITRADELDAALVEIAGIVAEGTNVGQ